MGRSGRTQRQSLEELCAIRKIASLCDTVSCGRLFRMTSPSEKKAESITASDLFPDLQEKQLHEVRETLDEYCELLLQIFERLERERRQGFDDDLPGP
jgi:hypothetical protein